MATPIARSFSGHRLKWTAIGSWPTGAKLFLALSLALLPLAIIATLATWQTTRIVNVELRDRLRIAAAESSRALAVELVGDMTALRAATTALDRDPGDAPICARLQGVFAAQAPAGARFEITGRRGRLLCGQRLGLLALARHDHQDGAVTARLLPDGLALTLAGGIGRASASAFFPAAFLAEVSRPSTASPDYDAALRQDGERLPLVAMAAKDTLDRRETMTTSLNLDGLALVMQIRSAPITWPLALALLLPLFMWAAAAGVSWFVVDRLLVRPLRQLRAGVAAYHPGDVIDPGELRRVPAQEIRDLGDTFRAISRTVALHEEGLAEGLIRQMRLTREVHHRVKNNLQVISSLISIHARGAEGEAAAAAYASIQRRVDALAVVHRNHYAESEESRGLPLRSVLGELASSIRATAPERAAKLVMTLEVAPYLVGQDVAVAVAFLVTEAVELAISVDPATRVRVALDPVPGREDRALLSITSPALLASSALESALTQRYGRVMEGLARQLRAPLTRDQAAGRYSIEISVTGRD